jgi:hypothetical protein
MRLGMTVRRLLAETDSRELAEWQALFMLKAEEQQKKQATPEEIEEQLLRMYSDPKKKAKT